MSMPAGTYYVGDLCYVMHPEWDDVCDLLFAGHVGCNEGEFNLKDGRRFAIFNTTYGDGTYSSNIPGQEFYVDSGSIGCILLSDISEENPDLTGGEIVQFASDFTVSTDGETLTFGHIHIQTGYTGYEEEYEDEEDY